MDHPNHEPTPSFWKSPAGLAWLVVMAVGGYCLFTEHKAHLYGVLPYLVLAACPLMHLFMLLTLAINEERDSEASFGEAWRRYAAVTPRFIPRFIPRLSINRDAKTFVDPQGR